MPFLTAEDPLSMLSCTMRCPCGDSSGEGDEDTVARHPLVLRTARVSLAAQVVFALVTASVALVPDVSPTLSEIVLLETAAQVVEFAYYAVCVLCLRRLTTWSRYIDWFISTPVMLLSTALFMRYLRVGEAADLAALLVSRELAPPTWMLLGFNALMLGYGLGAETGTLERRLGLGGGWVAFLVAYGILFAAYARPGGGLAVGLWLFLYVIWGLYGVAAVALAPVPRAVAYNGLDVVSKNFYGALLLAYVLTR